MTSVDWQGHWAGRKDDFVTECRAARSALLADLKDPRGAQRRVLADIVDVCQGSLHWQEQGFGAPAHPDAFRAALPLMRYEDFEELIERETRTKGGTLACSPVPRWLKTSGTTGAPKRIPYSLHWMANYRNTALQALWGTYLEHCPQMVAHPHATLDTQTVREEGQEFLHGAEFQAVTNRHPRLSALDWHAPWHEAPWFGPDVPSAHERRMYHRLRHLLGRDVRFISAINPSTLVSLRDVLAAHGPALVKDLRDGTVEGRPWPDGVPDPETADRVEAALAGPEFRLTDIWPSLDLYTCWMSASTRLYQSRLDALFPGVAKVPFMSCGSEAVTAIPVDDTLGSQPLAVNQGFFEFVPAQVPLGELLADGRGAEVRTLLCDELTPGHEYHLVTSQANGLYRLWYGDIYHVDRLVDGVPWVHLVRRDGVFHSFTGEKLTEAQVTQGLEEGFAALGCDLGLYMCGPRWAEPPYYTVLVESAAAAGRDREVSEAVDRALRVISVEYAAKRDSERLAPLDVVTVPTGRITAYVESKRQVRNATQYKYKPFHKDVDFVGEILGARPGPDGA
ncbi:GH3 auxin-responsive promoter family protein [Streptomyces sioyaensis]|uniref:GH3 family domain-containing protein n=1 Tax=Streptomyces sioyaensis TaxID=67364 RepID=UPI0037D2AE22